MASKDVIFDFSEKKFFRLKALKLKKAITSKVSNLLERKTSLLDDIEESLVDLTEATVSVVAVLDNNNQSARTNRIRAAASEVVRLNNEIDYLSSVARNIIDDELMFYDIAEEDLKRFGL